MNEEYGVHTEFLEPAVKAYLEGEPLKSITARFRICTQTLYNWLDNAGVERTRRLEKKKARR